MKRPGERTRNSEVAPLPSSRIGVLLLRRFRPEDYAARHRAALMAEFQEEQRGQIITELADQSELLGRINTLLGATGERPKNHYDFSRSLARKSVRAALPHNREIEIRWDEGDIRHGRAATVGLVVKNEAYTDFEARFRGDETAPRGTASHPTPYAQFYRLRQPTHRQNADLKTVVGYDFGLVIQDQGLKNPDGTRAEHDPRRAPYIQAREPLDTLRENWDALCSAAGTSEDAYSGPFAGDILSDAVSIGDAMDVRNAMLVPQGYDLKIAYF